MPQPQYGRPGTLWYVSDGLIWDDLPFRPRRGPRRLECSSRLFIFNPQRRTAQVCARFFHTDRPPTHTELAVGAGRIVALALEELAAVPHRQPFWMAVESDLPVLPQARHEDYTFWDPAPDAMVAVTPYPGPLADETSWVFPDCYEGDPEGVWYELETLTILNPNPQPVSVRVRYLPRYFDEGAEEEFDLPAQRVAGLNVWERTPRPIGRPKAPPVHVIGDYAVRVDACAPVICQTTRRARWSGFAPIIGSRSTMAFPLRGRGPTLWYYPGGEIVDRGILPRADASSPPLGQCDNTWNLLFLHNPGDTHEAHASVTFHQPDGAASTSSLLSISPRKSALHCLHAAPWLGEFTQVNQPYALTVKSDRPLVPDICGAEFEPWSQVIPGAMTAVNLYPGPLREERTWWLGIGQAGGADDHTVEWEQSFHLFNPGRRAVKVTLSFHGATRRAIRHEVVIGAGAVGKVSSAEIEELPMHAPFAVRAEGDAPFCAQSFGRTFTRGLAPTRAMHSAMGLPMALEE
jgi:hypothetical protein